MQSRESAPKDHQSSSESVVSDNISKTTTPSVEALNKELIELRQQFLKSKEGDTEEQGRRNSLTIQDVSVYTIPYSGLIWQSFNLVVW